MTKYFSNAELLKPPLKRAAYSDRTSYLMAEMSRLAYFRFEGGSNKADLISSIKKLLPDGTNIFPITKIIEASIVPSTPSDGRAILSKILKEHGFDLVTTYDKPEVGTQAFLCKCEERKMVILAFRGTEATSIKDIKADISASLNKVSINGKQILIHDGYLKQFRAVEDEIKRDIKTASLLGYQKFVTGHSLGGALAITTLQFLRNEFNGACYTFGSPPVGTKAFHDDIKTPIYRIVNHVDIVPRLPSPTLVLVLKGTAMLIGLILAPFANLSKTIESSNWYNKIKKTLLDAQKYRQCGYVGFLEGNSTEVRLLFSLGVYDRVKWWVEEIYKLRRGDIKMLSEHSIDEYSKKLAIWAESRKT